MSELIEKETLKQGWQQFGSRSAHYFQSGNGSSVCKKETRTTGLKYFESDWDTFLCQNCWHKLQEIKSAAQIQPDASEQQSLF